MCEGELWARACSVRHPGRLALLPDPTESEEPQQSRQHAAEEIQVAAFIIYRCVCRWLYMLNVFASGHGGGVFRSRRRCSSGRSSSGIRWVNRKQRINLRLILVRSPAAAMCCRCVWGGSRRGGASTRSRGSCCCCSLLVSTSCFTTDPSVSSESERRFWCRLFFRSGASLPGGVRASSSRGDPELLERPQREEEVHWECERRSEGGQETAAGCQDAAESRKTHRTIHTPPTAPNLDWNTLSAPSGAPADREATSC